jgi:hypothetical protein
VYHNIFNVMQVDLLHTQFKRAKERSDSCDDDLFNDLMSLYNSSSSASVDADILRWLSEKLQLVTIYDLNHESLTLHEMASGGDPSGIVEKMSTLLKEIKNFVQAEDPEMGGKSFPKGNSACPVIPDDFRCPISLDLMKDPVIVATGQVLLSSQILLKCFHSIYRPCAFQLTIIPCICLCRLMSEVKGMQQQHCLTCVFTRATRGRLLELDTTRTTHGD